LFCRWSSGALIASWVFFKPCLLRVTIANRGVNAFQNLTLVIAVTPKAMGHPADFCEPLAKCPRHFLRLYVPFPRFYGSLAANTGPNRFHQYRAFSWPILIPPFCSRP